MSATGRNRGSWPLENERMTPSQIQTHFLIAFLREGVAGGDEFGTLFNLIKMRALVVK